MQEVDNPTKFNKHNTNIIVSHLCSLLVFGVEDLPPKFSISKLFHARFKLLKVLDLQGAKVIELPQNFNKPSGFESFTIFFFFLNLLLDLDFYVFFVFLTVRVKGGGGVTEA